MPKRGRSIPKSGREAYAPAIARSLKRELGETHQAVKTLRRWTGAGERTVKNWLAGSAGPSGQYLLAIIRYSDDVLETVLLLAGRREIAAAKKLVEIRNTLAHTLERVDLLMEQRVADAPRDTRVRQPPDGR
jgi:hypothetical protein